MAEDNLSMYPGAFARYKRERRTAAIQSVVNIVVEIGSVIFFLAFAWGLAWSLAIIFR